MVVWTFSFLNTRPVLLHIMDGCLSIEDYFVGIDLCLDVGI